MIKIVKKKINMSKELKDKIIL